MISGPLHDYFSNFDNTTLCTSLNCANSPMVTKALALSGEKSLKGLRKPFLTAVREAFHFNTELFSFCQVRGKLQRPDDVVTLSIWRSARSPFSSHTVARKLRTTNRSLCSFCVSLHVWWTPTTGNLPHGATYKTHTRM